VSITEANVTRSASGNSGLIKAKKTNRNCFI
jgi:hypothetical protein